MPSATPSVTPSATPTPDPFAGLTIADLRARSYGGGAFEVVESLGQGPEFARALIRYESDGLWIHGFMNVPRGPGPFPVAIVLHGYIDPAVYTTLAYTTRYADALARAGYLVIHPNLRGYPPSDSGPNAFRIGMAIDVLNLIALVRAGEGPLAQADGERIGLMGHSMGGGITWRAIAVTEAVDGAVLYGSMSADERQNAAQRMEWSGGRSGREEAEVAELDMRRLSPSTYLAEIGTPISLHHSDADATVPPEWSAQAYEQLVALGKDVEYYRYQNTPHTFRGEQDAAFIARMVAFFDRHVKASPGE
ncbi:MAG: alpha/beta fold hydrolase [Chloroflexi bacterium]|nr:alpha/beta fold hydrolase [Chloroflexota bacterium]